MQKPAWLLNEQYIRKSQKKKKTQGTACSSVEKWNPTDRTKYTPHVINVKVSTHHPISQQHYNNFYKDSPLLVAIS